jgi:hypothetical protein
MTRYGDVRESMNFKISLEPHCNSRLFYFIIFFLCLSASVPFLVSLAALSTLIRRMGVDLP